MADLTNTTEPTQTITVALDEQASAELAAFQEKMEAQAAAFRAEREALESRMHEMQAALDTEASRRQALEAEARRTRFAALVDGWYGAQAENVALLEQMAGAFGEDSATFTSFVQRERALTEQIKAGPLFREIGSDAPAASDNPQERATALATARAKERNISHAEALKEVFAEDPALHADYRAATTRRGGN